MGNKNKTISFRVNEDAFETLREIAEERDISLSSVFRDYVDAIIAHDGKVKVVPEHEVTSGTGADDGEFPPTVEVPKSFVREHERLELEADHLRDQLDEYKQYVTTLSQELENQEAEEVVQLEDLDADAPGEEDEPFHLG
ncbi:CopG family transcriptional regulator [Halobacteriales archaeon SW_12_69_24]|nr:MAG: CopG family transcriptional regulator [Halobacteriales archaeon SW_12_69_24]